MIDESYRASSRSIYFASKIQTTHPVDFMTLSGFIELYLGNVSGQAHTVAPIGVDNLATAHITQGFEYKILAPCTVNNHDIALQ